MKFLVLDSGVFCDLANALAEGGKHQVLYHTGWSDDPYPKIQDIAAGTNYQYLTKVRDLSTVDFSTLDCVVCFNVHRNDEIITLKKQYPNLSIVGSGKGKVLEEDREGLKKWCKVLGLDVQPYEVVIGLEALEAYTKIHKDVFVKLDIFRSSLETVHIDDYASAVKQHIFENMRQEFGPVFSKTIKFIVEDAIQSDVEIGFDGFFTPEGGYLNQCLIGYEYNKGPYLARVFDTDAMPEPIQETMDAFAPILKRMDYRGPLSTEEKCLPNGKHYLLDFCARLLAPGSSAYPYVIKNWVQLIYDVGLGQEATIDFKYPWVGALPLHSLEGEKNYVWIEVDKKYRDVIRYHNVCSDGTDYFSVKGTDGMVCLVAGGETPEEVIDTLTELMDHVSFDGKDENEVNLLQKFPELLQSGESCGISLT